MRLKKRKKSVTSFATTAEVYEINERGMKLLSLSA